MKKIICILALSFSLASCEDFLQREPLDFGSEVAFFKDVADLEYAANNYYEVFPKFGQWSGGLFKDDENSDNQASNTPSNLFYEGDKRQLTVTDGNCVWNFKKLRGINYSLTEINKRLAQHAITGSEDMINHYLGELYFFRAYEHFRLLQNIGDAPILTKTPTENFEQLVQESTRKPSNEVARFILDDLQRASELMKPKAPVAGRLSKDAALLMRARVALFEATWLKYHRGTPFVPDYANSPNVKKNGPYTYPAGSIEAEYNFFFDQAIVSADLVASARTLDANYQAVFNNTAGSFSGQEVILARFYKKGINGHNVTNILGKNPGGTGYTHDLVKSFLLRSGKPIYKSTPRDTYPYKGDKEVVNELANRDLRLQMSTRLSGLIPTQYKTPTGEMRDTIMMRKPPILTTGNEGSSTGYEIIKYVSYEEGQDLTGGGTSATPIFRAAEAYLIYLEAYYERNHSLGGNCDKYWRALRTRAGVESDYNITINNTDLDKEFDLGKYSRKELVDKTLYNIRRERRCEFIAEGMRLADLKRWRSLDNMQHYIVKGFNLWDSMYKEYDVLDIKEGENVSSKSLGKYLQPFGIVSSGSAYRGYNFQIAHYLEPIPVSEFKLTATGGDVNSSPLYQNPGWSNYTVGPAADNNDASLK
ncbi:MAG: RagB/SusD family nutrient uptake outer membrane protein [Bacteroidaceae bacterium]